MRCRKPIRLRNYDYSRPGYYFITICTHHRMDWFGKIENGKIELNELGSIVDQQWKWLEQQYPYIHLDEFITMPNHFHGIIIVGNGRDRSLQKIKSISELIGAFKTTSSKLIHKTGCRDFHWQKSFHDHIIRNERSLNNIRQYILDNPIRWKDDVYFSS